MFHTHLKAGHKAKSITERQHKRTFRIVETEAQGGDEMSPAGLLGRENKR